MAINFPDSPSNGTSHTASGVTWTYDGTTWKAEGSTATYVLPTAAANVLGGVKVGTNLSINGSGVLSASGGGATISNNADNRVITGGTGTNLNAESSLQYDGNALSFSDDKRIDFGSNLRMQMYTDGSINYIKSATDGGGAFPISIHSGNSEVINIDDGHTQIKTGIKDKDGDLGTAGQVLSSTGTQVNWIDSPSGSGLQSRATGDATSSALANNAAGNLTIVAAKTYSLLKIQTSHAAWVTLYTDTTSRTNDAVRTETTDPLPGSGIIAEVITSDGATQPITPGTIGWNNEGTPTTNAYVKVVNKSGSTADVTVTLHFVALEA